MIRQDRAHLLPVAFMETTATPVISGSLNASAGGQLSTVIPMPEVITMKKMPFVIYKFYSPLNFLAALPIY